MAKKKNKRGALHEIKKKKLLEKQLDGLFGKKFNIETQVGALESAAVNKEVMRAMQQGAKAIKSTITDGDIDKVEDIFEDINEAIQLNDDMNTVMGQEIGEPQDEEDINEELKALEAEIEDETFQATVQQMEMPSVPTKSGTKQKEEKDIDPPQKEEKKLSEEEQQLAELNALMGVS